ncbi:MAG: deoxyguanosinetriphosphate triphosphohydrolase [Acidobacteriota bacterium]|jgi:dGTPase|nr:deoxyguanosinetriphosphate triphosphohydrolase [Acidobacteriota bacterium]
MIIREHLEERELSLHLRAARSCEASRQRQEGKSAVRTEFQRDRDRILHSKAFRRLKRKTQVFISPEGDHYRTRLTHTLEVSQISRTISRALNINEDLTEAIALGHDLGHTPFGHAGEHVLNELSLEGFRHNRQSLRVVDQLEYHGKGLNLTDPVRDGILRHSKGKGPILAPGNAEMPYTLEGQVVRISDIIAYVNHDLDDAIRAEMITREDIPENARHLLGNTFAKRIDSFVKDVIYRTLDNDLKHIAVSPEILNVLEQLRDFLFERVYWVKDAKSEMDKIHHILSTIHKHLTVNPGPYINPWPENDPEERRIIDFIAGMTDNYAINLFKSIVTPRYRF